MTQTQSSDINFSSFFYYLKLVITNLGWTGDTSPNIFTTGTLILPPNFCTTQSRASLIKISFYIFLPPEVSNNKPEVDEGNKPPNNLVPFLQ